MPSNPFSGARSKNLLRGRQPYRLWHCRLLSLLRYFFHSSSLEKAVHLLHREIEEPEESLGSIQVNFEQACRDAINLHGLDLRNPREKVERPSSAVTGWLIFIFYSIT